MSLVIEKYIYIPEHWTTVYLHCTKIMNQELFFDIYSFILYQFTLELFNSCGK